MTQRNDVGCNEGEGHGSGLVYLVEARTADGIASETIGGEVYTREWRTVRFHPSPIGIAPKVWLEGASEHGFLSFESAEALAAWFRTLDRAFGIETRLVEVEYIVSWKATRRRNGAPTNRLSQQQAFNASAPLPAAPPSAAGE